MCSHDELFRRLKRAPTHEVIQRWQKWLFTPLNGPDWKDELAELGWTHKEWDDLTEKTDWGTV